MNPKTITTFITAALLAGGLNTAYPATTTFNNRATFEAQLGTIIVDDYSNPGYLSGDVKDLQFFDVFTNAGMNSVIGETDYQPTKFSNRNVILKRLGNTFYCAGCNGTFTLGFTTTSVGDETGVFGVGFRVVTLREGSEPLYAFVTFGDGSTKNFELNGRGFFGITSDLNIQSIHVGLLNGVVSTNPPNQIAIDHLTIGSDGSLR